MKILGRWDQSESNSFIAKLENDLVVASARTVRLNLAVLEADSSCFIQHNNKRDIVISKPGMYECTHSMVPQMYSGFNSALILVPVINNNPLWSKKAASFTANSKKASTDPLQNTSRTVNIRLYYNDVIRYEALREGKGFFYVPKDDADFSIRRLHD